MKVCSYVLLVTVLLPNFAFAEPRFSKTQGTAKRNYQIAEAVNKAEEISFHVSTHFSEAEQHWKEQYRHTSPTAEDRQTAARAAQEHTSELWPNYKASGKRGS